MAKLDENKVYQNLSSNLVYSLTTLGTNKVFFSSDNADLKFEDIVFEIAKQISSSGKSVLVAKIADAKEIFDGSQKGGLQKQNGIDFFGIDSDLYFKNENDLIEKDICDKYQFILVICPTIENSAFADKVSHFSKNIVLIAKNWFSKYKSMKNYAENLKNVGMNVLGVIQIK